MLYSRLAEATGVEKLLATCADLYISTSDPERATRLLAFAQALLDRIDVLLTPQGRRERDRKLSALRESLGEESFTAAWEAGQRMSQSEIIAHACGD